MKPIETDSNGEKVLFWNIKENFLVHKSGKMTLGGNQLHYHPKVELYLLLEGECEWFVDDQIYSLRAGDVALIPPRVLHKRNCTELITIVRYVIYCDESNYTESVQKLFAEGNYYVGSVPKGFGKAEEMFDKVRYEFEHADEFSHDMIKNYLSSFAALLFRYKKSSDTVQIKSRNKRVEAAITYIKNNYSGHVTLDDAAKYAETSGKYLSRAFKNETGFNFNEYLTLYRLKQSEFMLMQYPNRSILEIAYDCGFNDSNYFTARFKKVYGFTPSELRKGKIPAGKKHEISL